MNQNGGVTMATKNTNKGGIVAKQKEYSIATHKIPKFKSN